MKNKDRVVISAIVTKEEWFENTLKAVIYTKKISGINDAQIVCFKEFSHPQVKCVKLEHTIEQNLNGWNYFMSKCYNNYINNEFLLNVHDDGFAINGDKWTDEFLNFDYIGALWGPQHEIRCGNGGFSLRSKKLLDIQQHKCEFIPNSHNEDAMICNIQRSIYINNGIKYGTNEIASQFSIEEEFMPEYYGQTHSNRYSLKTFGFHHGYSDALNFLKDVTI
jgi:hypothetical protein